MATVLYVGIITCKFWGTHVAVDFYSVVSRTVAKKVLLGVLGCVLPQRVRQDTVSGAYHSSCAPSVTWICVDLSHNAWSGSARAVSGELPGRVFLERSLSVSPWSFSWSGRGEASSSVCDSRCFPWRTPTVVTSPKLFLWILFGNLDNTRKPITWTWNVNQNWS